jgi:hypothetical protein
VGHYNTFVVKIWCDDYGDMIRGHIQHVSSQQYDYFSSLNNMTDFIVSRLGPPPNNPVIQNKARGGLSFLTKSIGDIGQDE